MPNKYVKNKRRISRGLLNKLKKKGIKIKLVTDAPSGSHIFCDSTKGKLKKALKEIANDDERFHVGKTSKSKIVLDPAEPNVAVPGSLSYKGEPYKRWKKI